MNDIKNCLTCANFIFGSCNQGQSYGFFCRNNWHKRYVSGVERLALDDDKVRSMGMFYFGEYRHGNGFFTDWEEFFEWWGIERANEEKPTGTKATRIELIARGIVEQACEKLYEDAYDNADNIDELQELLDQWCAKQSWSDSYEMDHKVLIEIPWHLAPWKDHGEQEC